MLHNIAYVSTLYFRLRRNYLIAWIVSLLVLTATFPISFESYYPDLDTRTVVVHTMQSTMSTRAMYGVLEDPGTIGQMVAWNGGAWITVLCSVMAILLFNSLYRIPEESGHSELIRSVGVSHTVMSVATVVVSLVTSVVIGAGTFVVLWMEMLMVDELTFRGALSFGIVASLTFIGSMLIAAIISALLPSALFVNRIGLLSIAVAFIMRAIADIEDIPTLNWLSLLGWRSVIKPYTNDSLSNAALCLLLCIGFAVLWGFLELNREYGTGCIPARSRDAIPPRNVGGMLRLRWVLERGQLATWGVAVMIMSGFLTSLTGSLKDLFDNEQFGAMMKESMRTTDLQSGFLSQTVQIVGILVAIAGVQMVLRLRMEEKERLVDLMCSTGIRRWTPLGSVTVTSLVATLLLMVAGAIASLFGARFSDDPGLAVRSLLYGFFGEVGPVIAMLGVAVMFVGALPRYATLAWTPLVYCVVVVFLGDTLKLPEWAMDLSVFNHPLFADEFTTRGWIPVAMAFAGIAASGVGIVAASWREVR